MGLSLILLTLTLLQSAFSTTDDAFENFANFNPEDDSDIETYFDRQSRSGADKFLRFGKAFWDYDSGSDSLFDDREVQRPFRTGGLSGNPPQRTVRDKSSFLRFGRSVNEESKKNRGKREASSEALKRHENYLRFGRNSNSNFMRFGRNLGVPSSSHVSDTESMEHNLDRVLLNYLRHLLRQSEETFRHKNVI